MKTVTMGTAWEIVVAVTADEDRWLGTPEDEVNGIYDALEESGMFTDYARGVVYVLATALGA